MKKILIGLCLTISIFCYAQDIEWKLIRDSEAYDGNYDYAQNIKVNEIVNARSTLISLKDGDMKYDYATRIYSEGIRLSVDAEAVIPNGTQDLLDENLLTPAVNRRGKTYLNAYTIDILKSQNRETAQQFVPKGISYFESDESTWWRSFYDNHLTLFQTVIKPTGIVSYSSFYIINIIKNGKSYTLEVENDQWGMRDTAIPVSLQPEISGESTGYRTKLTLYPDGEYLDIFYEDKYLLGSYITVDYNFVEQLESLLKTNTCDLSNITRPRRADKAHSVGATCVVAESLRLRKEENTSSATIQIMQPGTQVQILQLGKKQTIDGISANWVQVQLADGNIGWCFGGWLVEK